MIEGIVQAIKQREKGYSILLDNEEWYSGFGKCPVDKGDKVSLEYKQKDQWKNITKIEKSGESLEKQTDKKNAEEHFPSADKVKDSELKMRLLAFKSAFELTLIEYQNDPNMNFNQCVKSKMEEFIKIIGGYE